MRIRRLELVGFKSFITRTRFQFHDGITAVVGPNGCGKSNVVDAIRWVLGEQSPSHLRGRAMEDVIFSGNERIGPLGMAEVSIALERTGAGPIWDAAYTDGEQESDLYRQLAGASEIMVTRRYFRSGESQYLINKVPCRLRDITDLFLGSGLGSRAYAIIEQGRVDQLVNAKPDALRLFIEEAAGTTRYRSRRIVAERKIERTRDHLTRLIDIIREIERQTNSLTRQAKRAEEYRRYREELKAIEMRVARRRYRSLVAAISTAEKRLGPLAEEEALIVRNLRHAEDSTTRARSESRAAGERQRAMELSIVQMRLEGENAVQRLARVGDTVRELERRVGQLQEERQRLTVDIDHASSARAIAEGALRSLLATATETLEHRRKLERDVQERTARLRAMEALVEEAKSNAVDALVEEVRVRNLVEGVEHRREEIQGHLLRAEGAYRSLEEAEARCGVELETLRASIVSLRGATEDAASVRQEHATAVAEAVRAEAASARDAEDARERVAGLRSRLHSLEELRARWDGCAQGVRHVVARGRNGVLGLVADVLRVPKVFEAAVAAALGERLQCLIVRDHGDAVRALRELGHDGGGRASFLPVSADRNVHDSDGVSAALLNVIETPAEYRGLARALLGNVTLVDTLAEAVALWRRGTRSVTVTKSGELIDSIGMLSGGSERPLEETLLARNREIREVGELLALASAKAAEAGTRHRVMAERVEQVRRLCENATSHLQALRIDYAGVIKDEDRLGQERDRLLRERETAALDLNALRHDRSVIEEQARTLAVEIEKVSALREERDDVLEAHEAELARLRAGMDETRAALTVLGSDAERHREEETRTTEALRDAAERTQKLQGRLDEIEARIAEFQEDLARLAVERAAIEEQRECKRADLTRAEAEGDELAVRVDEALARATKSEEEAHDCRDALEQCREARRAIDVELAERRAAVLHLVDTIKDRYREDLSADACSHDNPQSSDEDNDADSEARIEELRARLCKIGEVNVGAIEELDELRTRHEYLTRQRDDLQRSIEDLRRTIAKLNRMSRTRFRETFEQANEKLGQLFPRLFPGGQARLILNDAGEGAEPGVEIQVQPVGKKLGSLTLLSGGEKALTAVALILSLFMIRPTPFCVLDEVDAPLDEGNVGRFDQLIREISGISQFVLITHNKRTMEAADALYGITMEQAGVSKVVSVRLKQAA